MDALVRERYPGLLSRSRLESGDWVDYAVDASRAERELGMGFRGMEGQVEDVVEQQLELGYSK